MREADLPKTAHAMASLKAAMKWDEEVYGREYDLDLFNIVAVDDFNFGAMENKGLNIFNSRYVLADQETATDADFDAIAGVVAHEYFHNWSGDRVTCRDWFQLSLKEGFTVFRDQSFSADMGSEAVKRIDDVRLLRAVQFPEDMGPLAHPVRPESYHRDHQFLHRDDLQQGRRGDPHDAHDHRRGGVPQGQRPLFRAPRRAGGDVRGFRRARWRKPAASTWRSSGCGTARRGRRASTARLEHDAAAGHATLHLTQAIPDTPGQSDKAPMVLPLKIALIGADSGAEIARGAAGPARPAGDERDASTASARRRCCRSTAISPAPAWSRSSARPGELEKLAEVDPNPFARFEALQELMMRALLAGARGEAIDAAPVIAAMGSTLRVERARRGVSRPRR